jgi:hypothetical protein
VLHDEKRKVISQAAQAVGVKALHCPDVMSHAAEDFSCNSALAASSLTQFWQGYRFQLLRDVPTVTVRLASVASRQ